MQNEALQAALALYHAPNERFSLLRAELPRDIGIVLRLASGPQPLLHDAAAGVGESETVLLEAIRFYLQLMLFQPEANAYRVLGLAPDAPQSQIREHHRWLQRWLHPDRRGEDWTLYAPRVNWAWNQLHNERTRQEYDREQVIYRAADGAAAAAPEHPRLRPDWMHPAATRERMTLAQRLGLGVLIGLCGVLLYLASTRQDTPPADMPSRSAATRDAAASAAEQPAPPAGPTLAEVRRAMEREEAAHEAENATAPAPADAASSRVRAPAAESDDAPPAAHVKAEPVRERSSVPPRPHDELPPPGSQPAAVSAATTADTANPSHAASEEWNAAASGRAAPETSSAAALRPAAPKTSSASAPTPAAPEASSAASSNPAVPIARSTTDGAPSNALSDAAALVRARLARSRVQELSQFFGAPDQNVPPIWNDAQGQSAAEGERHRLHTRVRWDGAGDFSVETPVWRLSENRAALDATYRVHRGENVSESGRLSLHMVWREEMWLVTQVALEPAQ